MSRHQVIDALAKRYADRRIGRNCCGSIAIRHGVTRNAVATYAKNWLAQYGKLPQGVHRCTSKASMSPSGLTVTVDFTRLIANEPGYPESESAEAQRRLDEKFTREEQAEWQRRARAYYAELKAQGKVP